MKIRYRNKRIKKLLNNPQYAVKTLGNDVATKVYLRKDQIQAADDLRLLVAAKIGRCHPLHYDFKGMFGLDLKDQLRLIIQPDVEKDCIDYEEKVKCKSVIIIGVVDYHGQKNEWIFR